MKSKIFPIPFALFLITAFSALTANSLQMYLFKYIILFSSMIYLFTGWYIFRGYLPGAKTSLLFFYGYAYSSIIAALAFSAFSWPFAKILLLVALFWMAIVLLILIINRPLVPAKGFGQMIAECAVLLVLVLYHLLFAPHYMCC